MKYQVKGELPYVSPLLNLDIHQETNQQAMQLATHHAIIANFRYLGFIPIMHIPTVIENPAEQIKKQKAIEKLIPNERLNKDDIGTL